MVDATVTFTAMKSFKRILGAGLVSSVGLVSAWAGDSPLVPPQETVAGRTQLQWSKAWWQWAASFELADSPVTDRTGARCGAGQSGDVWFLAGTYGSQRTIRRCTVPAGTYLFFPLINYIALQQTASPTACHRAQMQVDALTNAPRMLLLDMNGQRFEGLEAHRQRTEQCFDAAPNPPHQEDAMAGSMSQRLPLAGNGYYVMLRPLPRGTYTLNFGGQLSSSSQAVTYTLDVR